ncbi:MAG: AbrB/MazE/SpoVT family DNA-binding domain-containing protein [Acidimicrobiales bacterium]
MRATIDAGGRVVVPKAVRERLGLQPGSAIELTERDGWIEIAPAATPMTLVGRGEDVVASTDREMPVLTAEQVRAVVEQTRR